MPPTRKIKNHLAEIVFSAGGISIIFIILLLIFFLFKEFVPLFKPSRLLDQASIPVSHDTLIKASKLSEDSRLNLSLFEDGTLVLTETQTAEVKKSWQLPAPFDNATFHGNLLSFTQGPRLIVYPVSFVRDAQTGIDADARLGEASSFSLPLIDISQVAIQEISDSHTVFAAAAGRRVYFYSQEQKKSLLGPPKVDETKHIWQTRVPVKGLAFYPGGNLLVALADGEMQAYNGVGKHLFSFNNPAPIRTVGILFGGRGLCIGGQDGSIHIWAEATAKTGRQFFLIHSLEKLNSPIEGFAFNERNRTFAAWDTEGNLSLYQSTSERRLISFQGLAAMSYAFNAKGDTLLGYGRSQHLYHFDLRHAEVSWKTLFGKVWYEGYQAPGYTWQSTGGTQDFEPKFSLIPLMVGTFKGAFFAMLFALPLAITGALFMNQFLHPSMHPYIKPVVEIMAGLPSVIIGFLAGLWLAPALERSLPGVLLACLLVPSITVAGCFLLEKLFFKKNQETFKIEILALLPVVIITFWICLQVTPWINDLFFRGNFKQFIFDTFATPYDQRNAMVVGFAMGFAVVPIIFSLTEDALSFVPREIIAGSLALGLSRWKTATGVVLRAAAPGILSAIMVGFGRAIGETMIVLMATGNTPIMSLFPFNGFRTMSANIAVELPEAPVGDSLYRILFLMAFLLFLSTFIINTGTDLLRNHWHRKLKGA